MNATDTQDGEIIDAGALVVRGPQLPELRDEDDVAAFVRQKMLEWKAYQELTKQLLDESDYQKIGRSKFKKKSAWRKYARAFTISCQVVNEQIVRDESQYPIYARFTVRATTPDGRFQESEQECHITERCCQQPCAKRSWDRHTCCPKDCPGKLHFSHPGDLPATAHTRAKNRAIADLIGAGEVSAEEMADDGSPPASQAERAQTTARQPKPAGDGQEIGKLRNLAGKALDAYQKSYGDAAYEDFVAGHCPAAVVDGNVRLGNLDAAQCEAIISDAAAIAQEPVATQTAGDGG